MRCVRAGRLATFRVGQRPERGDPARLQDLSDLGFHLRSHMLVYPRDPRHLVAQASAASYLGYAVLHEPGRVRVPAVLRSGTADSCSLVESGGGKSMSESHTGRPAPSGPTLERSPDEVLNQAEPLPWDDDMIIDGLTEDEEALFLAAIRDA